MRRGSIQRSRRLQRVMLISRLARNGLSCSSEVLFCIGFGLLRVGVGGLTRDVFILLGSDCVPSALFGAAASSILGFFFARSAAIGLDQLQFSTGPSATPHLLKQQHGVKARLRFCAIVLSIPQSLSLRSISVGMVFLPYHIAYARAHHRATSTSASGTVGKN